MSDMQSPNDDIRTALGPPDTDDGAETGDFFYDPGIEIPEDMQQDIVRYVKEEVEAMETAREGREALWATWRRHREARPEFETRTFPWDGASNVVPPVAASNTMGVFSHIRRAFLKRKPLFTPEPHSREMKAPAEAFGKLLNLYFTSRSKANAMPVLKKALYEAISLADQVVEVPWVERRVRFTRPAGDGGTEKVDKVVYRGPELVMHKIEYVFVRPDVETLQDQPVIGITYPGYTPGKLRELERDGFFRGVDGVVDAAASTEEEENLEIEMERSGIEAPDTADTPMIDLMKAWVYWDIDGDNVPEDVIIWFHPETETILRVEMNEFGVRLLANMQYLPKPFSFYSTGVGQMAEHIQEEITSLHNMRIDSTLLHSLQMVVTRPGTDLGRGSKLHPLKHIKAEVPREDINILTFPDVSAATLQAEMQAKRYLDLHTGVSEAMLGMPDQTAKSGTSPSLQMFLAEQGNSLLESAVESLSESLSEIGMFFTLQLVHNSEAIMPDLESMVSEEDLEAVRTFLSMTIEDVPLRVGMAIKVTDVQKSEDAKRQNLMALNQLYTMYAQEVMQYMQVIQSPEVPQEMKEFALRIYLGKTKVMEETLELFGTTDTDDYVPFVRDVEMMLEQMDAAKRQMVDQMAVALQQQGGMNAAGQVPPAGGAGGGAGPVGPDAGAGGTGAPGAGASPAASPTGGAEMDNPDAPQ